MLSLSLSNENEKCQCSGESDNFELKLHLGLSWVATSFFVFCSGSGCCNNLLLFAGVAVRGWVQDYTLLYLSLPSLMSIHLVFMWNFLPSFLCCWWKRMTLDGGGWSSTLLNLFCICINRVGRVRVNWLSSWNRDSGRGRWRGGRRRRQGELFLPLLKMDRGNWWLSRLDGVVISLWSLPVFRF